MQRNTIHNIKLFSRIDESSGYALQQAVFAASEVKTVHVTSIEAVRKACSSFRAIRRKTVRTFEEEDFEDDIHDFPMSA